MLLANQPLRKRFGFILTRSQLRHDGQDSRPPLQRHQRKLFPAPILMTGPRLQMYALAGHCRPKDANLWAHPEKKSLDRLWRVFPLANLLPFERSSLAPPAESSSAARPWPSWTPVTPTSSASSRLRRRKKEGNRDGMGRRSALHHGKSARSRMISPDRESLRSSWEDSS